MPACTVHVTDTASYQTARNGAATNAVICLDAGTYSRLDVFSLHKTNVTIRPSGACGSQAVPGIYIDDSSGYRVVCFEVTPDYGFSKKLVWVDSASTDIVLDHLNAHGANPPVAGQDLGVLIDHSSYITISNSTVCCSINTGISILRGNHYTVSGNTLPNNFDDAIQASDVDFLTVTNNLIYNFTTGALDHPDAIQFLTNNNGALNSSTDAVISNNTVCRGILAGAGHAPQGVFLGNEQSNDITSGSLTTGGVLTVVEIGRTIALGGPDGYQIQVGDRITCSGCIAPTYITGFLTGTGYAGTYQTDSTGVVKGGGSDFNVMRSYLRVTITGNKTYGTQNNGIGCGQCEDLVETGNEVHEMTPDNSDVFYGDALRGLVTGNFNNGALAVSGYNDGTFTPNDTTLAPIAPSTACPPV